MPDPNDPNDKRKRRMKIDDDQIKTQMAGEGATNGRFKTYQTLVLRIASLSSRRQSTFKFKGKTRTGR
jgi:hypothetical protein